MTTTAAKPSPAILASIDVPDFCFLTASATVVLGMTLGLYMGVAQDHRLAPVHVHMNVIGWLGLFMVGLFYRIHSNARGRLVSLQAGAMALGHVTMTGGLAGLLLGGKAMFFAALLGAILLLASMILFFNIVMRTAAHERAASN